MLFPEGKQKKRASTVHDLCFLKGNTNHARCWLGLELYIEVIRTASF